MKRLVGRLFSPIPILMAAMTMLQPPKGEEKVKISSQKIEQKKEEIQLSKQRLQRMKGKKARKNRGRNRGLQDTAIYASLRR